MKKIHLVAHTHWDREWYFTTQDALLLSDQIFTNVIETLENDKKAQFCLDGQTSIVEEYLQVRPDMKDRLMALVAENRLTIGPWYTQTDCLYVDGESILRNLVYGMRQATQWGQPMHVAYLPDTFGFNKSMPSIIKSCDINNAIIRRGFDHDVVKDSYFKWKGLDGQTVDTVHLYEGYGGAHGLDESENFRNNRLFPYVEKVSKYTDSPNLLVCSGGDQVDIIQNFDDKVKYVSSFSEDDYFQSNYEEFFEEAREYFKTEYTGDLRIGKYDRVHRSIGSIRYDIKKLNATVEKKLLYVAEPLLAIGNEFGIKIGTELLYKAWKLLMEGQAHDGMGGCITDEVAKQVIDRFLVADEIADCIINLVKFRIAEKLQLDENKVIIFNTDIKDFSGFKVVEFMSSSLDVSLANTNHFEIMDYEYYEGKTDLLIENPEGHIFVNEDPYYKIKALVDCKVPSMGFAVFEVNSSSETKISKENDTNYIQAQDFKITFDKTLKIEKSSGEIIENFITFEDAGNDGDTYDFSPLKDDQIINFSFDSAKVIANEKSQSMILTAKCELPATLEDRISRENTVVDSYTLTLTVFEGTNKIDAKLTAVNSAESHRLRLAFKTNIITNKSIASIPFGFTENFPQNGQIKDWRVDHVESTVDLEVLDEMVTVANEEKSFNLITTGIKEYQLVDDILYLTLFSATGQLGKPNLLWRPGRASGDTTKKGHVMIPTPQAQLFGEVEFEFSFILENSSFDEINAQANIANYNHSSVCYQRQSLNKFINRLDNKLQVDQNVDHLNLSTFSLMNFNNIDCEISSISPSLVDNNAFILRLKNCTRNEVDLSTVNFKSYSNFEIVNSVENSIEQNLTIKPYGFINIKLSK